MKTVCSFIGAQAPIDTSKNGGRNPLIELASELSIFGDKSPEQQALDAIRGEKVADSVEDDLRFGKVAADPEHGVDAANGAGSYEAFLSLMGGPPPMPGRG